jgi:alanine racemase
LQEALQVESFCKNILILLPLFEQEIQTAVEHNFILTVDSFSTLQRILSCSSSKARVHLKIETGMNRLGFESSELAELVPYFNDISIEGAFSHFYGDTITQCDKQLQQFNIATEFIEKALGKSVIKHIANTSGVLLSQKYFLDMARIGLGLYGYSAQNLSVAKTVVAKVIAVREVFENEVVGYGGIYKASERCKIAIVNCGYANGFSRVLRSGVVKINNNFYNIVGNICMAMLMVKVSDDVKVGDDVILLGDGVNNANDNIIVYELLCNLH